jgi:hypothetical protein
VAPEAAALAQAMGRMLDPALREHLATGARTEGARLADWGAIADRLSAGIEEAMAR